jgi:hypothetical protein
MGASQTRSAYSLTISAISDNLVPEVRKMVSKGHEIRVVFDNCDFKVLANIMLSNHQNSDYHWIAQYITFDRVSSKDLDDTKPIVDDLTKLDNVNYLLNETELKRMRAEMVIIVGRVLVEFFESLRCLKVVTQEHIGHKYSKEMEKASTIINLPVVPFNQIKHAEVCDYLDWLEEFLLKVYAPDGVNVTKLPPPEKLKLMEKVFAGIISFHQIIHLCTFSTLCPTAEMKYLT